MAGNGLIFALTAESSLRKYIAIAYTFPTMPYLRTQKYYNQIFNGQILRMFLD